MFCHAAGSDITLVKLHMQSSHMLDKQLFGCLQWFLYLQPKLSSNTSASRLTI